MRTMCSRAIFAKKCRQQQIFDSDLKGAWHYNHVTFTPIAKNFILYCRLIYMLFILCVRLTIKVKVGIPESFKVGWYPPIPKKTGSSHLKLRDRNFTACGSSCFKIVSNFTRLTAREIRYNNFEISLVVFMSNITTNHAITYTYTTTEEISAI